MNEIHNRYVTSVQAPNIQPGYGGWKPCIEWCKEQIVDGWWYIGEGIFEFVDETDRTMFILRWS